VKKAKLDLLEEMPEIELPKVEVQPVVEDVIDEAPVETGRSWVFSKLIIIGVPAALLVLVVSGLLVYFLYHSTKTPSHKTVVTKTAPEPVRKPIEKPQETVLEHKPLTVAGVTKTIYIKDFMIDLKDNKGNNRVLLCDVAFDVVVDSGQENLEESENVRNIIYRIAQSRGAIALKSIEERKKLKKELAEQLDKMAGKTIVKNVYFLKYFIM